MNNQLTVLIPTSPIPSHPGTAILDETISNVRKYTDAAILILVDGVHESMKSRREDYWQYVRYLDEKIFEGDYGDCSLMIFKEHSHQSQMTKEALKVISTPLIMFCEHDTSPIGDIPFQEICNLVENQQWFNYVRFNIFEKIPIEHDYLMITKEPIVVDGIPLIQTIQFSARPHIAKTNWYRNIIADYFEPGEKMMIEDRMHSVVQSKFNLLGNDIFGMSIYAPPGNQLRSYHADGRGGDEKLIYG